MSSQENVYYSIYFDNCNGDAIKVTSPWQRVLLFASTFPDRGSYCLQVHSLTEGVIVCKYAPWQGVIVCRYIPWNAMASNSNINTNGLHLQEK